MSLLAAVPAEKQVVIRGKGNLCIPQSCFHAPCPVCDVPDPEAETRWQPH